MTDEPAKTKIILDRLVKATGVPKDSALAGPLGVTSQAIYDAKKRNKIPDAWIRNIAEKYDISADWLLFGRGPMRPGEPDNQDYGAAMVTPATDAAKDALEAENKLLRERLQASELDNVRLREQVQDLRRSHETLALAMKALLKQDKLEMPTEMPQFGFPDQPPLHAPPKSDPYRQPKK
jgi:hypothetical protein